jgi:hypothetical protein
MSDLLVNLVSKSSALLTSQKTRITGICICLVLAIVESVSSWRNLNSYGMFFSVIYVVALLLMIWFPIPASMGLCICSIVSDIVPILIVAFPIIGVRGLR